MGTFIPQNSSATFLVSPVEITASVSCAVIGSPTAPNTTYVTVLQGRDTQSTFRGNGDEILYGKDAYSDKITSGVETILTECEILLMYSSLVPQKVPRASPAFKIWYIWIGLF